MDAQGSPAGPSLMHIVFRSDASLQIGTGHVMRCLTLADALTERGAQCTFICRPHSGHLLDLIRQRGHEAIALDAADVEFNAHASPPHAHWLGADWVSDAQQTRQALGGQIMDWLVVDHYALDRRWEQALRPYVKKIMVIDDLADRPHDCDLLLDQNLGRTESDYSCLLNSAANTQILIGPKFALLRPEFAQWREYSLARRAQPQLKNLLITMGGVDKNNATGQVLDALKACAFPADLHITVVMGLHAPWLTQVQALAAQMPWPTEVLVNVSDMARCMVDCDLAIGAAGSASWERCCLGVPTLMVVLAENQVRIGEALSCHGAAVLVEESADQDFRAECTARFSEILIDKDKIKKMSRASAEVTDGTGGGIMIGYMF